MATADFLTGLFGLEGQTAVVIGGAGELGRVAVRARAAARVRGRGSEFHLLTAVERGLDLLLLPRTMDSAREKLSEEPQASFE